MTVNNPNAPRSPGSPRQHQTREARNEADAPRREALIPGSSRGTSRATAGSSRPPEGRVGAEGGARKVLPRQDQEEPTHWKKEMKRQEGHKRGRGEEGRGRENKEKLRRRRGKVRKTVRQRTKGQKESQEKGRNKKKEKNEKRE